MALRSDQGLRHHPVIFSRRAHDKTILTRLLKCMYLHHKISVSTKLSTFRKQLRLKDYHWFEGVVVKQLSFETGRENTETSGQLQNPLTRLISFQCCRSCRVSMTFSSVFRERT